jgi:hypothetical protein
MEAKKGVRRAVLMVMMKHAKVIFEISLIVLSK